MQYICRLPGPDQWQYIDIIIWASTNVLKISITERADNSVAPQDGIDNKTIQSYLQMTSVSF